MTTTETWTPDHEAALRELQARKERVLAARLEPVEALVRVMPSVRSVDEDTVTSWLIENADAMRDALKPFDSGVRAAAGEG